MGANGSKRTHVYEAEIGILPGLNAGELPLMPAGAGEVVARTITGEWRRWESKTSDFESIRATTGNHRKLDPELPESKDREKPICQQYFLKWSQPIAPE